MTRFLPATVIAPLFAPIFLGFPLHGILKFFGLLLRRILGRWLSPVDAPVLSIGGMWWGSFSAGPGDRAGIRPGSTGAFFCGPHRVQAQSVALRARGTEMAGRSEPTMYAASLRRLVMAASGRAWLAPALERPSASGRFTAVSAYHRPNGRSLGRSELF
jgi:hypothetical protein